MEILYSKTELLPYSLGGLLYTPATNKTIAKKLINKTYDKLNAIVFCLEDSIKEENLKDAERQLKTTLKTLKESGKDVPLLFVRVRSCFHLEFIHYFLGEEEKILTGYVLPKFDMKNSKAYCRKILEYNAHREKPLYIMPILESHAVAEIESRVSNLTKIKNELDLVKEYVLNVRVGGNDFSNIYGIRRNSRQNIYEIGVIRDILVNIINVFASDYVVSGPVWEYFGTDPDGQWADGLRREVELDLLNGFIGKTAIHPSQLPVIYDSLKVDINDYMDAKKILGWDAEIGVSKSAAGDRMNELTCHSKWAKRTLIMAKIYGIKRKTPNTEDLVFEKGKLFGDKNERRNTVLRNC